MDSVSDDTDYEVSAEMLIHGDIDDERTLEEEEIMDQEGEIEGELSDLQKESEMPLEQLLAAYGYHSNQVAPTPTEGEKSPPPPEPADQIMFVNEEGTVLSKPPPPDLIHVESVEVPGDFDGKSEVSLEDPSTEANSSSNKQLDRRSPWFRPGADPEALARLRPVPERRSIRMGTYNDDDNDSSAVDKTFKMWLASDLSDEQDDDSATDDDYTSNDWQQNIKVGAEYQAKVSNLPTFSSHGETQDDLVWSPNHLDEESLAEYLSSVEELVLSREGLPCLSYQKDNEEALHTLLLCNYDVSKALTRFSQRLIANKGIIPWTEDECRKFETGLRMLGKDFFSLQKQVPTRTVKEIVEFYYLWKKTERYDAFAQQSRNGKKFTLQPGYISDLMEELLEPPRSSDFADIHYGSTTLAAEVKRERSLHLMDERLRHVSKTVSAKSS